MDLRVTAAGRAALADADNVGARAVRITRVLLGSGQGPGGADDDARTALRTPRDAAVAGGATGSAARIAVRADVEGTAGYQVTEVGLEAVAGDGAPFLFAYWTNAGEVYAAAAEGVAVLVTAAIDIVAGTPATLTVDVDPTVALSGASSFGGLSDVSGGLVAERYYRGRVGGERLDPIDRAAVLSDLLTGLAAGTYPRVREVAGVRSLEGRTASQVLTALTSLIPLQQFPARASSSGGWGTVGSLDVPASWYIYATFVLSATFQGDRQVQPEFRIRRGTDVIRAWAGSFLSYFGTGFRTFCFPVVVREQVTVAGTYEFQSRRQDDRETVRVAPAWVTALPR